MILKNTKFKYSKAREMILDAILSGNLAPDSVLPSEQKLCDKLGVSRITLRAALHELEQDGIIIKQNGRPSQVNPEALRKQQTPLRRIAWVDTSPIGYTNQIYFDIFRSVSEQAVLRNVKLDYISLYNNVMAENFLRRQHEYDGSENYPSEYDLRRLSPFRHQALRKIRLLCRRTDCSQNAA